LLSESDESGSDGEDSTLGLVEELVTLGMECAYQSISNQRYFFPRKPYRKGYSKVVFEINLVREEDDENGVPPWLTHDEFVHKYRMNRESFKKLLAMIKDHPVFQRKEDEGKKGRKKTGTC
jgi:hypothetical protein